MSHERALSALRDAGAALNDLEAERVRLVESLALAAEAGVADDKYIAQLEAEIAALKARIAELEGSTGEPDPPIIVEPPPTPTTGDPDFSSYGFAHLMPAWKRHQRPTEADCDWIVDGAARLATSRRGLGNFAFSAEGHIVGELFKRSLNAGHRRPTIGVKGYGGRAALGGRDGASGGAAPFDVCKRAPDGSWLPIDVQFVGLSDDAALQLTWGGQQWGRTERLASFDLGIVGSNGNHGVAQNQPCGEIIFDRFWMLYPEGHPAGTWDAGLHVANTDRFVARGLKRRGRRPSDPAAQFRHHSLYLKHSSVPGSETWILDCDLSGGGQTGVQKRPGKDEQYLTAAGRDTLVVAGNKCNGYGWDRESFGGGSAISQWSSPHARTFIVGNEVLDARGGCLMVGGQPLYTGSASGTTVTNFDRNWYDAEGYPIGEVYCDGNRFENARGDRHCVSLSNAKRVFWGDRNVVTGRMGLVSEFIATRPPAMPRGNVTFVGDRGKVPATIVTYDAAQRREVPMTAAQINAMHQAAWAVPVGL